VGAEGGLPAVTSWRGVLCFHFHQSLLHLTVLISLVEMLCQGATSLDGYNHDASHLQSMPSRQKAPLVVPLDLRGSERSPRLLMEIRR
jgi:hypothetical protein